MKYLFYKFLVYIPVLLFLNLTFLIKNSEAQWVQTNGPFGGMINCFAISGSKIYAGTNGDGVFYTTNNGSSWIAINNGLTNLIIYSLSVSGSNIYAGTYGSCIFISTNNGTNWNASNNGLTNLRIMSLAISGTTIFAGTNSRGIFKSTNNGANWDSTGLSNQNIYSIGSFLCRHMMQDLPATENKNIDDGFSCEVLP